MPEICHLYVSPGHNYFGHHGREPDTFAALEVEALHCLAGRGVEGDRFLDFKPNYKGQITFFTLENYERLCAQWGVQDKSPAVFRRNVIVRGLALQDLEDREFEIQGIRFRGRGECAPCYWMDRAFHPGAEEALQGNGGLRAQILTEGWLRRGDVGRG